MKLRWELFKARCRAARKQRAVGELGLKSTKPGGNAHDRRKHYRTPDVAACGSSIASRWCEKLSPGMWQGVVVLEWDVPGIGRMVRGHTRVHVK